MSEHTNGPWFTKREGFSTVYVEARIVGGMIQEVAACGPTHAGPDQQEANARLIAAAPDLLEACQSADRLFANWQTVDAARFAEAINEIRAAIAKAKGQPS